MKPGHPTIRSAASITSIALSSLALRPVFSSLAAAMPEIRHDLALSTLAASALSMIPVACLGLFSFSVPYLVRWSGPERTLSIALLFVAIGSALRGFPNLVSLASGTIIAGAGIAVGNVILPAIVKGNFSRRIGSVTALYTALLCGGAAMGAAATPVITRWTGSWSSGLAVWSALPLLALLVLLAASQGPSRIAGPAKGASILRAPTTWHLTAFMGLQSALAYTIFGWLAWILETRGLTSEGAGRVVASSIIAQIVSCGCVPLLAARSRNQSAIAVVLAFLATAGLGGLVLAERKFLTLIAVLQGLGQGGLIALALTLITMRSISVRTAGQLSAFVQGVGYLLAAGGLFVTGLLAIEATPAPLFAWFLLLGGATALAGGLAGRNRMVG